MIRIIAERRPLMIAIDDLHRIDEPSAAFLSLLSNRVAEERVTVVAAIGRDGTVRLCASSGLNPSVRR